MVSKSRDPLLGRRRSSVRFVRFIFHSCVYRDPVHFPSLAPIVRECLFKAARIWSDVRHNESNKDGSAVECFLGEKLAAAIFELADRGWAQGTALAVGKIQDRKSTRLNSSHV